MQYIPAVSVEMDPENHEAEMLTVLGAARRMGVTQSAILRWIRNGYLHATPSSNGWQIPASKLADAAAAADDARGTGSVPRKVAPSLQPAPIDIRRSMAVQAHETPARLDVVSEEMLTPLVELVRDQIDVVHDQAEVIGWLQAERARLDAQLTDLKAQEQAAGSATDEIVQDNASPASADDEVLSWLWKDAPSPFETGGVDSIPADAVEPPLSETQPVIAETPDETASEATDPFVTDEPIATVDPAPSEPESFSTPSWFVTPNDIHFRTTPPGADESAPRLRPIVARNRVANNQMRQMIDETEDKIAQLWREEERLRASRTGGAAEADVVVDDRESLWQRLWSRSRRSSL